jgi:hypothetical protein
MSRTYWRKTGDNSFEFLGAFSDGHSFDPKKPRDPAFVGAGILDFPGHGVADTMRALNDRFTMADVPARIRNKLSVQDGSAAMVIEWQQIEGYLK